MTADEARLAWYVYLLVQYGYIAAPTRPGEYQGGIVAHKPENL